MKAKSILTLVSASFILLSLAACTGGKNSDAKESSHEEKEQQTQLAALFMESAPENAITVAEARENAEPGQELIVTGRIAGQMKPLAEDLALVTLVDDTVETCDMIPGDTCPTPWDACCEAKEVIAANRLTVQFLNADGKPIRAGLKGINGVKELDRLVVKGTADESSTADNLIINADRVYRASS